MFQFLMSTFHTLSACTFLSWQARPSGARLSRWERIGLIVVGLVLAVLAVASIRLQLFMPRRMGDQDVFFRAAWAVRSGNDIYQITDDNGLHYHYPPLLAILLAPLADPPAGADRYGNLPYAVSVVLWCLFNSVCLIVAVHWLATALEGGLGQAPDARRWWALRVLPMLTCFPPIRDTILRGQVNLLLLLLVSGLIAAVIRGQRLRSGLYVAGAICLKLFPAFLLVYPLWRRDGRCLAGCLIGLVAGLIAVPAGVFGPRQTWDYLREWNHVLIMPGVGLGSDQSRARELTNVTAGDNQALLTIMHNTWHGAQPARPERPSTTLRLLHLLAAALLTTATLAATRSRDLRTANDAALFLAMLVLLMLLLCPVCHLHYFCLTLPLVMILIHRSWLGRTDLHLGLNLKLLLSGFLVANYLPLLPGLERTRDFGLAAYAALLLWVVALQKLASGGVYLRRPAEINSAARSVAAATLYFFSSFRI